MNAWKQLLKYASKDNNRIAINGVHVTKDGFGQATNGHELLRILMPADALEQIGEVREVIVPYAVAQALAAGASAELRGLGWHIDGSEWSIPMVQANYPDTSRVIPTGGDTFTVKLPLAWLRDLDKRQWSRADRAYMAHHGFGMSKRLGVVAGKPHDGYDTDTPMLALRRIGDVWDCDIVALVREPAPEPGKYRQRSTRQFDWKPDLLLILDGFKAFADRDGNLTLRSTSDGHDPVAVDLPDGGVYVRMPLRDGPWQATEWQTWGRGWDRKWVVES